MTEAPARRCPECGKPSQPDTRPFCSPRCRDLDLGRWLDGSYAIPQEAPPEGLDEPLDAGTGDAGTGDRQPPDRRG